MGTVGAQKYLMNECCFLISPSWKITVEGGSLRLWHPCRVLCPVPAEAPALPHSAVTIGVGQEAVSSLLFIDHMIPGTEGSKLSHLTS